MLTWGFCPIDWTNEFFSAYVIHELLSDFYVLLLLLLSSYQNDFAFIIHASAYSLKKCVFVNNKRMTTQWTDWKKMKWMQCESRINNVPYKLQVSSKGFNQNEIKFQKTTITTTITSKLPLKNSKGKIRWEFVLFLFNWIFFAKNERRSCKKLNKNIFKPLNLRFLLMLNNPSRHVIWTYFIFYF